MFLPPCYARLPYSAFIYLSLLALRNIHVIQPHLRLFASDTLSRSLSLSLSLSDVQQ